MNANAIYRLAEAMLPRKVLSTELRVNCAIHTWDGRCKRIKVLLCAPRSSNGACWVRVLVLAALRQGSVANVAETASREALSLYLSDMTLVLLGVVAAAVFVQQGGMPGPLSAMQMHLSLLPPLLIFGPVKPGGSGGRFVGTSSIHPKFVFPFGAMAYAEPACQEPPKTASTSNIPLR